MLKTDLPVMLFLNEDMHKTNLNTDSTNGYPKEQVNTFRNQLSIRNM